MLSGKTSMSLTIQSASLPVVDANRCAEIAPAITTSMSMASARPMCSCIASAARRAMCTTQRLCSMKVIGQLGTSSVNGIRFKSSGFSGLRFDLQYGKQRFPVESPLIGKINVPVGDFSVGLGNAWTQVLDFAGRPPKGALRLGTYRSLWSSKEVDVSPALRFLRLHDQVRGGNIDDIGIDVIRD